MQNPIRFIDLGLGFSLEEKSLIKVIKGFLSCLYLTDLKADSTTAVASFSALASLQAKLQR